LKKDLFFCCSWYAQWYGKITLLFTLGRIWRFICFNKCIEEYSLIDGENSTFRLGLWGVYFLKEIIGLFLIFTRKFLKRQFPCSGLNFLLVFHFTHVLFLFFLFRSLIIFWTYLKIRIPIFFLIRVELQPYFFLEFKSRLDYKVAWTHRLSLYIRVQEISWYYHPGSIGYTSRYEVAQAVSSWQLI
jgi:hypothetical protein